jgi:hypothetical protein
LQNGGKRGPDGVGTNPKVKELWDGGSIKRMWDYLTRNATDTQGPPGYQGPVRVLPDGTKIGLRQSAKGWDDTLDVARRPRCAGEGVKGEGFCIGSQSQLQNPGTDCE